MFLPPSRERPGTPANEQARSATTGTSRSAAPVPVARLASRASGQTAPSREHSGAPIPELHRAPRATGPNQGTVGITGEARAPSAAGRGRLRARIALEPRRADPTGLGTIVRPAESQEGLTNRETPSRASVERDERRAVSRSVQIVGMVSAGVESLNGRSNATASSSRRSLEAGVALLEGVLFRSVAVRMRPQRRSAPIGRRRIGLRSRWTNGSGRTNASRRRSEVAEEGWFQVDPRRLGSLGPSPFRHR